MNQLTIDFDREIRAKEETLRRLEEKYPRLLDQLRAIARRLGAAQRVISIEDVRAEADFIGVELPPPHRRNAFGAIFKERRDSFPLWHFAGVIRAGHAGSKSRLVSLWEWQG